MSALGIAAARHLASHGVKTQVFTDIPVTLFSHNLSSPFGNFSLFSRESDSRFANVRSTLANWCHKVNQYLRFQN